MKKKQKKHFLGKPQKEPNKGRQNKQKTKNTHQYEQKCQSHTCSGTINSSYVC
jgi:hypothetical protein